MVTRSSHYEGCTRAFNALAVAHRAVSIAIEEALGQFPLSISEFDVMVSLDNRPNRSSPATALAGMIQLSQPAVSRLLDRLEKRGIIARSENAKDRRGINVQLTESGYTLLQRAVPVHERCIREKLLAFLTEEERGILRRALVKIADANGVIP